MPEAKDDARALATYIAKLTVSDKDWLLILVAEDQAARARMELLRSFRGESDDQLGSRPRRTVRFPIWPIPDPANRASRTAERSTRPRKDRCHLACGRDGVRAGILDRPRSAPMLAMR